MVGITFNHEDDIFHQLAKKNLQHIVDHILSYLDIESLTSVEMVSPLHYGLSAMKMSPPTATVTVT